MFALFGCGFFIVPIVLFVWAIVTIVRAITLPRDASRVPACERCGYAVADLASFTCPECGVDLRLGGIITPAIIARTRGSLTSAILAWTYIAGVAAYITFTIGIITVGFGTGFMGTGGFTTGWSNNLTPFSGHYQSFEIIYDTDFATITSDITLTLVDNSGTLHTINLDPNTRFVTGLTTEDPSTWSPTTVETFFAETGLDTKDPQVVAEADEITKEIDLAIRSPRNAMNGSLLTHHSTNATTVASSSGPAPFGGTLGPPPAVWLATAVVGIALYLLGILFIVRRRRRLLTSLNP